jgi:hypothetical protein
MSRVRHFRQAATCRDQWIEARERKRAVLSGVLLGPRQTRKVINAPAQDSQAQAP